MGSLGLVLTRKVNEAVMIGDDICVRIVDVRGDKVRIAFKVPREIGIYREEVRWIRTSPLVPATAERETALDQEAIA
jgi:carbon storage regulator